MNSLETIERDIKELKERFLALEGRLTVHERGHGSDTELLAAIVETLGAHQSNHHSRASTVRLTVSTATIVAVLALTVELVRQFLL